MFSKLNNFDNNGTLDPIISYYVGENSYPFASRDDMVEQMPLLKKKFTDYKLYPNASVKYFFTDDQLKNSQMLKAEKVKAYYLENKNNKFEFRELPFQAQFSPVFTIQSLDINNDGNLDIILEGIYQHQGQNLDIMMHHMRNFYWVMVKGILLIQINKNLD